MLERPSQLTYSMFPGFLDIVTTFAKAGTVGFSMPILKSVKNFKSA
jgi:hypothetical protein